MNFPLFGIFHWFYTPKYSNYFVGCTQKYIQIHPIHAVGIGGIRMENPYKIPIPANTILIHPDSHLRERGIFLHFKKCLAFLLAVGSFGGVAAAPAVTLQRIPTVQCSTPQQVLYEKHINANGTIEAQTVKEVYLETPVLAQEVYVSVGDFVQEGQVIAVIDTQLTKSVLQQSIPASSVLDNLPTHASDMTDFAGLYSAFQSSGLELDSLEEIVDAYSTSISSQEPTNPYLYIPETVVAPMSGIVTEVGIKSNVLSRTAKPVVTIADTKDFIAKVTVGESFISDIHVGDYAKISGTGFSEVYSGYVSKIYPVARKLSNGTAQETVVDLELTINEPGQSLKAGFSARAEIITDHQREILTVPYEAIQQDEENVEYVYLAKGSQAVRCNIQTGLELLEGVEIVSGLGESDLVIMDAQAVQTGERITLKRR